MTDLTSTQAFWLGHLFHASSRQLALSKYAEEQALDLASLLAWEQRLVVQGMCPCHLASAAALRRRGGGPMIWPETRLRVYLCRKPVDMRKQIDGLAIERQFGPSTEKYRVAQGDLPINEAEVAVDEEEASAQDDTADDEVDAPAEPHQPARRRTRGGRVALPPVLPRIEVIHELPEGARHCHQDGTELKEIGKEIKEELHVVPARVEVIRHLRFKSGCRACEEGGKSPRRRPSCCRKAMLARPCSPMWRPPSIRMPCRSTGRARSLPATVPRSRATPWPYGWCRLASG
ncbi:Transposase C of IS166 homeodomain-containing protein [Franzmannia pantelleriensis]|uniref:Transposase C of IS166 homeodomain-containing protein n=1 Tax=Franzmannia pantelleriensis TaxID=48727 RepID=A0A1G9XCJ9_9GAMM|nr:IS66 family transposase zinc-finger binding domain-containing protein [Halomonas pantelleriensis]SDM94417.1 Transposase C of IS166 homeodomain-containing protein [Halomonas pantelleriensis]